MVLMVTAAATAPALALEYEVEAPDGGMFAPATSVEQVTVVGGGPTEADNIDRSKNAAVVPPPFGSPESYQDGTGEVLTPQPTASAGGSTSGSSGGLYYPPADIWPQRRNCWPSLTPRPRISRLPCPTTRSFWCWAAATRSACAASWMLWQADGGRYGHILRKMEVQNET